MNDYLEFIRSRRSCRKYLPKQVEREKLEKIIEAGRCAPSGCNSQTCHLIVVQKKEVVEDLIRLVHDGFAGMEITEDLYFSVKNSIKACRNGAYNFTYGAPTVVIVANQIGYQNAYADTACMIENMLLMANALDLGTCYVNQLRWLNANPDIIQYVQGLGMEESEFICGAVVIGYPDSEDGLPLRTPIERFGNKVTYIE